MTTQQTGREVIGSAYINADRILVPPQRLPMSSLRHSALAYSLALSAGHDCDSPPRSYRPIPRDLSRNAIEAYFSELSQEHLEDITRVARSLPRMQANCQLSVAIPVAAAQEASNIQDLLGCYSRMEENSALEVVLFLNASKADQPGIADTLSALSHSTAKFPNLTVHAFYRTVPFSRVSMGYLRGFVTDVILLRLLDSESSCDPLIASHDCDMKDISSSYLRYWRSVFDQNPDVIAGSGQLRFDRDSLRANPHLRFYDWFRNELTRVALPPYYRAAGAPENESEAVSGFYPRMAGANSVFRPDSYARVGGYQVLASQNEDCALAHALMEYGGGRVVEGEFPSYVRSSARRTIAAFSFNQGAIANGQRIDSLWRAPSASFCGDSDPVRSAPSERLLPSKYLCSSTDDVRIFERIANHELGRVTARDPQLQNGIFARIFPGKLSHIFCFERGLSPIRILDSTAFSEFLIGLDEAF